MKCSPSADWNTDGTPMEHRKGDNYMYMYMHEVFAFHRLEHRKGDNYMYMYHMYMHEVFAFHRLEHRKGDNYMHEIKRWQLYMHYTCMACSASTDCALRDRKKVTTVRVCLTK